MLALVFGAAVAAADPILVTSLFKDLGAPHRFTLLIEGERLPNDGTAIVFFTLAPSCLGLRNLLECQAVAEGPVSASPSPTHAGDNQIRIVECCTERVAQ